VIVSLRPAVRHSILAILCCALFVGSSFLPAIGAEPKKKSSSSSATKKKSSTPKATPKGTPKGTPKSTPKSSPKAAAKATPKSSKSKKAAATPSSAESTAVTERADDADKSASDTTTEEPNATNATDASATPSKSNPTKATPVKPTPVKATPRPKATPARAIPDQPAPPLPTADGSTDAPAKEAGADPKSSAVASPAAENKRSKYGPNVSIGTDELLAYDEQPPRVKQFIEAALELSRKDLTYTYGSADPAKGGMDCSGAIYYLLTQQGFKDVPRDASGQYVWARKNGQFYAVISKKADSFEFGDLLPGDLLFWSGTYNVDRDPPVTHTMVYLGVQRKRGQHVMWGASDGRTYDGKARYGVSVFDFKMPRADKNNAEPTKADFLGYARIPGLRDGPPGGVPLALRMPAE
jgi:cell wall-associated NlpC family hydrolase